MMMTLKALELAGLGQRTNKKYEKMDNLGKKLLTFGKICGIMKE